MKMTKTRAKGPKRRPPTELNASKNGWSASEVQPHSNGTTHEQHPYSLATNAAAVLMSEPVAMDPLVEGIHRNVRDSRDTESEQNNLASIQTSQFPNRSSPQDQDIVRPSYPKVVRGEKPKPRLGNDASDTSSRRTPSGPRPMPATKSRALSRRTYSQGSPASKFLLEFFNPVITPGGEYKNS